MNIRNTLLLAADSIEQNPNLFKWRSTKNANINCGTPGCALGWIALYAELKEEWARCSDLEQFLGIRSSVQFYGRMNKIDTSRDWKRSAPVCAKALRIYADIHHPISHIPSSVRAIFEGETVDA